MFNDLDEDFPLNGGSEKLDRLFEENTLPDISFKLTGPKPPITRPKPSQNNIPLKVVFAKTVEAFQMKVNGYKSEGKVGIAIIGNDEHCYYQLYMYKSDEKKVASAEININFRFLIQQYNYASFRDTHDIQWSLHFDKPQDLILFSREMTLARWRSGHGIKQKLVQEAFKGNPDQVAKSSDLIRVSYTVFSLSPENILHEEEHMKRSRTEEAGSPLWECALVGACLGSRRFVLLPPSLLSNSFEISLPEGYYVLLEMELLEVSPPPTAVSQSPSTTVLPPLQHKSVVEGDEEEESLPRRMSKIGYALPSLGQTEEQQPHPQALSRSAHSTTSAAPPQPRSSPSPSALSLQSSLASSSIYHRQPGGETGGGGLGPREPSVLLEPCDISTTSQFNVLFSEVRTNNSEIRMNICRVHDKVDSLISKMDFIPKLNHEVIPALQKFQNLDTMFNKLFEQNSIMLQHLEKNSPPQLDSVLQENIQLKKRNAELESCLDVSRSTAEILKGKVGELIEKNLSLEKSLSTAECPGCSETGEGRSQSSKLQALEESLQSLQERNFDLLEASQGLQRQNQQLASQLVRLQKENTDKDLRISEFEKEIGCLSVKADCVSKSVEKGFERTVKILLNKIYRDLKEELKNSDREMVDSTLSRVLKESARTYLSSSGGDGPVQCLSSPATGDEESGTGGSLVEHYRSTNSGVSSRDDDGPPTSGSSSTPILNPQSTSSSSHQEEVVSSAAAPDVLPRAPPVPRPRRPTPPQPIPSSLNVTRLLASSSSPLSPIFEKPTSEHSDPEDPQLPDITTPVASIKSNDTEPPLPKVPTFTSDSPIDNETESTPPPSPPTSYNPYSSAYYTPFIPNTPPPIDDGADL